MKKYIVTLTTFATVNVPDYIQEDDVINRYIADAINENWDNLDWNDMEYEEVKE